MNLRRPLLLGARWLLGRAGRRFRGALEDPAAAQARVRSALLTRARRTTYGRRFRGWEDVPVVDWSDLAPWVERQRAGEAAALVADRVHFWERTTGSTGPAKRVPYTGPLLACFTRMFALWAHDVLAHGPPLQTGRFWFAVSPRLGVDAAEGTTDDRDFLTGWVGLAARPFWRSPPGLAQAATADAFWRRLATFLAAEEELEGMSVWSPSFLRALLAWMSAHREELPRGDLVGDWTRLWPRLRLVSCWDAGASARGAADLARVFPGVLVQGKGLLATEAPVTIPLLGVGQVPLVDTVGIELEGDGRVVSLEAAEPGGCYGVVVSQPAGFLRYRLGDRVRVVGHVGRTPLLELLGRPQVSDLVGEKLTEEAVGVAFGRALPPDVWATLVAREDHYHLVVDRPLPPGALEALDRALGEGIHYAHARALGQLGPLTVEVHADAAARELAAGPVWGGTKPRLLRSAGAGEVPWTP